MENNYNWKEIQEYYNQGHILLDIVKKFGCGIKILRKANRQGLFKIRNRDERWKLRYPNPKPKFVKKNVVRTKYNWKEIQKYYNEGHSWKEITKKFFCYSSSIVMAIKRGDFISHTVSDASKLARIRYPEKFLHSEETKRKLSEIRKKFLRDHPERPLYPVKKLYYPEQYFREVFEKENIPLGYHKRISIYELDFYNDEKKIAIEVDGEQHYLYKSIVESDKRKDAYLEDQGWKIFRIRWSAYQKLPKSERERVVREIKAILSKEIS